MLVFLLIGQLLTIDRRESYEDRYLVGMDAALRSG